jgi:DNA polymerase-3 subunit delta'
VSAATRCVWDDIVGQDRASALLRTSADGDVPSHAYLFVGPAGVGKRTAAKAFACALVCEDGGCGGCRECSRVRRGLHPDVRLIEPEGAATYLVEQVRDVISGIGLRPVEASRKIYVFDRAHTFNPEAANALLKSLEEPPDDVVIVLLADSIDAVLPTIVSRCQVVRFERIPEVLALDVLVERAGLDRGMARATLAASGGVLSRALELASSRPRMAARDTIVRALKDLPVMDGHDVLETARSLMEAVRAPLGDLEDEQAAEVEERRALLGTRASMKPLEERHKRELTAKEREGLLEILNVTESWLRDCLALSVGAGDVVANVDQADAMEEVAQVLTPEAAVRGFDAACEARKRISYNVSPQLALEAMLFDIREVLRCPR